MDSSKVKEMGDILYDQVKLLAEDSKNADSETIRKNTEVILSVFNSVF